MSPKEKQATPKVAFVFLGPLTNESPAKAGSRARKRGIREFTIQSWSQKSSCKLVCKRGAGAQSVEQSGSIWGVNNIIRKFVQFMQNN